MPLYRIDIPGAYNAETGDRDGGGYNEYSDGGLHVVGVAIEHFWSGVGTTNAPATTNLRNGTYGADQDGVAGATLYYVVNGTWTSTGALISQFHGGT